MIPSLEPSQKNIGLKPKLSKDLIFKENFILIQWALQGYNTEVKMEELTNHDPNGYQRVKFSIIQIFSSEKVTHYLISGRLSSAMERKPMCQNIILQMNHKH
jgi:ribosomal protein S3AE